MGDIADDVNEQGSDAWQAHLRGDCDVDGPCQYCEADLRIDEQEAGNRESQAVQDSLRAQVCKQCGKRTVVLATAWKGSGLGSPETVWTPASYENITPEVFCACPGGPAHPDTKPPEGDTYGA